MTEERKLLREAAGNLYMAYNAFTRNDAISWESLKETADRITALLAAPAPEPVAYLMIGISQHDENEPLLFLARELDIAEKYAKDQGVPITPLYTTPPAQDTRRLALEEGYELGWIVASEWAGEEHLKADIGSPAYIEERDRALAAKEDK